MSKRKKHSGNLKKQTKAKKEILQLEDCSKNDECGVSSVDEIKVIVFYNGPSENCNSKTEYNQENIESSK